MMAANEEHWKQGKQPGRGWQTFLMLAGSALLGGTAVALWNRRLLAELRKNALEDSGANRDETDETVEGDDAT